MHGNGTLLGIDTRTKGRGGTKQHSDLTFVHQVNHFLLDLITAGLLNETDFLGRNAIVIDELVLDLLEDIPLARLIGGKVTEDKLRTLLLVKFLIIVGNHAGAMAGLIVRVITETLLRNKAHIQRGLTAGIGGNKHLTLFLTIRERSTENKLTVASLGELYQTLVEILLILGGLDAMQNHVHIGTVKTDILTSAEVGDLIIEHGQLRNLHEITETLLDSHLIGDIELVIRSLLGIDSCPGIKGVNALLSHSLRTKVLEEQVQLGKTVTDGRTTEERRTKVFARAVLNGTDGIQQIQSLLTTGRITET